jgi:aryl-phospho-beta-D-glucosidase BglC (GH1 family)
MASLASVSSPSKHEQASQAPNGVPAVLMKKLTRGVNVTGWFGYVDPNDTAHFTSHLVDEDFQDFKKIGVDFIRLVIGPKVIYRDGAPDSTNLEFIDKGIDRLQKAGLAVLWDLHDNGEMKLDEPEHDTSGFVRFWQAVAGHYRGVYEKSMVFELLNEPMFLKNPEVWYALQRRTVAAIRAIDPARTILVASTGWDGIDTLVTMTPLEQKNIIYSFHFYDPFIYTHQGATWTGEQQKVMRDIPFPSSPEAVAAMIDKIPEQYKAAVRDYGEQRLGKDYLYGRLAKAKAWGTQNRVPVLLGEFGSYALVAPPDARGRWFDAMHDVIQELGLPNALWGYEDTFGLGRVKSADGKVHLDPVTMAHFYKKL